MIKVGQVRKNINGWNYAITTIEENRVYYVYKDGTTSWCYKIESERNELISEYPTWQEAVNSKEFNQ